MIDRSRQTAAPTHSRLAVQFKRTLCAGASVLALVVGGIGAGMVQPAFSQTVGGNGGDAWYLTSLGAQGGGVGQDGGDGSYPPNVVNKAGSGGGGGGAGGGKGGKGGVPTGFQVGGTGGDGGDGGDHGKIITADLVNLQDVLAQKGENGGNGTDLNNHGGGGGGGGAGGYGLVATQILTLENRSVIMAGDGGNGGNGGSSNNTFKDGAGSAGDGGDGGLAVLFQVSGSVFDNSGTLQGGKGGDGGNIKYCCYIRPEDGDQVGGSNGNGGKGGSGIDASGMTITNSGTIIGGDGGASGTGGVNSPIFITGQTKLGDGGAGGDGIVGSDLTIINTGTIRGGKGGTPGNGMAGRDGYAVYFTGGTNRLELHAGSAITGYVIGAQGTTNTLILGGDDDATFASNVFHVFGLISSNWQYFNFGNNEKTGASTWSLTGNSPNWTIKQGVLQIGDGGTAGIIRGTVNTGLDAVAKGTLAFNRSDLMTHGGVISGTGDVVQKGSGTTVLTGTNTYSGGTTLDDGTLSVSKDANLGDASGALSFNGGILQITGTTFKSTTRTINWGSEGGGFDIADAGNTFTVGQQFASGGALTKLGAGTLILTAANSYTGGTTVSGGILQLGNGTADGSIVGDIALTGGDLVVDNQGATTLAGAISGAGSVTQKGSGTLVLSGNNSYGDTYLNGGVISVGQDKNLGTGDLNFNGGTLQVTGTDFKGTTRTITWGDNGGGFDIADANNVFTLSNVFTGAGGLTKSGDGTLALSGDSNSFTGNTNVKAGTLRLDGGKLGDGTGTVDVASGASLGGHGTIG
ncbi:autotransporter-associated beta strand repeat-containing protein, partial [Ochrobactrum sp. 3-3]|uniref:autotransporter-associated beta strand repeat-containing protein n=1 Tax=Ochrobactrum sp. 3-3 TaxID=1830124 RepID=UPI00196399E2